MFNGQHNAHNNPYHQGGWSNMPPLGSATGPAAGWNPPQNAYGGLPVALAPAPNPSGPSVPGQVVYRFAFSRNPADFPVLDGSNRPVFRIYTGGRPLTVIMMGDRHIARIEWQPTPVVERLGRKISAPQFLRPNPGSAECSMMVGQTEYRWSAHFRRFFLRVAASNAIVAVAEVVHGNVEFRCIQSAANTEFIELSILAVTLLQGRTFVGLPRI
ncbi:hypothetical protein BD410DRAFT_857600 [Rickenella mellea]|uniref:Uncharacterized protein n=1 Tax=Rickenella mellea TaxID=50990 RepID=A0A4Y7Q834_9AGAM|nr:hypothetical protein BD410DRAFT_857600 [Rickenella mellea]